MDAHKFGTIGLSLLQPTIAVFLPDKKWIRLSVILEGMKQAS